MKKKDKKRSMPVRMISALIKIAAAAAVIVIGLNFYVIKSTQPQINATTRYLGTQPPGRRWKISAAYLRSAYSCSEHR